LSSEHRVDENGSLAGQLIHHHLPVAPRTSQASLAESAKMMRNQILRALADPGQVADAQLTAISQDDGESETRGIRERAGTRGGVLRLGQRETAAAQLLGTREIEAEKLAAIVAHALILTRVDM
jgi:hypothetical protein